MLDETFLVVSFLNYSLNVVLSSQVAKIASIARHMLFPVLRSFYRILLLGSPRCLIPCLSTFFDPFPNIHFVGHNLVKYRIVAVMVLDCSLVV